MIDSIPSIQGIDEAGAQASGVRVELYGGEVSVVHSPDQISQVASLRRPRLRVEEVDLHRLAGPEAEREILAQHRTVAALQEIDFSGRCGGRRGSGLQPIGPIPPIAPRGESECNERDD